MLRLNADKDDLKAKLDTGSEFCIFERTYAEALGLPIEGGLRAVFSTATGRFVAFGHWVTISSFGFDLDTFAYFAEQPEFNRNVLGMCGWIDRFQVGVEHHSSKLFLNKL